MPFDGAYSEDQTVVATGLLPVWTKRGWRHWLSVRFGVERAGKGPGASLRPLSLLDRDAAIVRLLEDAKGLIENPQNWAQGTYTTFFGRRCAVGALRAAAIRFDGTSPAWSAHDLLIRVARSRGFTSVEAMNDHSSHAEVLAALDEAIALAQSAALA